MRRSHSKAEAFYDAVACHDDEAARRLTTAAPSLMSREQEYEEDFFAVRLLMDRFFGSATAATFADWSSSGRSSRRTTPTPGSPCAER